MWWKTIANEIAWKGRLTYRGVWKCDICGSQDMELVNSYKADKAGSPAHEYRALMMYRCDKCGAREIVLVRGATFGSIEALKEEVRQTQGFDDPDMDRFLEGY